MATCSSYNVTYPANVTVTKIGQCVVAESDDEEHRVVGIVFTTLLSVLSAVGTLGNFFVLLCIVREPKLRTMANFIIAHLAAIHLVNSITVLPAQAAKYTRYTTFACVLDVFGVVLFMMALHAQLVISFNRFTLVTKPLAVYQAWFSRCRVCFMLSFFWTFDTVLFFLIPGMVANWNIWYVQAAKVCILGTAKYNSGYSVMPVTSVTFTVALCLYIALIIHIKKHSVSSDSKKRRDAKVSFILFGIMLLYLLTFVILPFLMTMVNNYSGWSKTTLLWIGSVAKSLQWVNYCVSPFIYGMRIPEFKKAYRKVLCPFFSVQPSDNGDISLVSQRESTA